MTRAAQRLRLSSPALSQQIKALERELGAALFQRTPTWMVLTGPGEVLLPEARAVLAAAERAAEVTRAAAAGRRTLRAATPRGAPAALASRLRTDILATGSDRVFEATGTGPRCAGSRAPHTDASPAQPVPS
ncbi:LysR family transcriptional regulator [Streptomyces sp. NPDC056190]|uniref:LysR family transcriptional regulator n=1 Tax=unclassified Streptomyces TaxID=2593676 RepID=UPI0035DC4D6F